MMIHKGKDIPARCQDVVKGTQLVWDGSLLPLEGNHYLDNSQGLA